MALKSKSVPAERKEKLVQLAEAGNQVQLNIRISESLRRDVHIAAIQDGTNVTTVIKNAIESYVASKLVK